MPIIDKFTEKLMFNDSARQWLKGHFIETDRYFYEKINYEDRRAKAIEFWNDPILAKLIIENYCEDNTSKTNDLISFFTKRSTLCFTIGRRGGGKTANAYSLAEKLHEETDINIYTITSGLPLPKWINQVSDFNEIEPNSYAICDEAGIIFSSRDAMTTYSKDVSKLLNITRHRDISINFISQSAESVDVNVLRHADLIVIKKMTWEQTSSADNKLSIFRKYIEYMMPTRAEETLYTDGAEWKSVIMELPTFWSDNISKAYSKINIKKALEIIEKMHRRRMPKRKIAEHIRLRGLPVEEDDIELAIDDPKEFILQFTPSQKRSKLRQNQNF